jgi:hypothetical protein
METSDKVHDPADLTPTKEPLFTHLDRRLGGPPRAGLDTVAKIKISSLYRESNSDSPGQSLVAIATELSQLLEVPFLKFMLS